MLNIIYNKSEYEISQRKVEMFEKYLKLIQWGRREPVHFMEQVFGLQFTDHQRYVLLSTWNARYIVWLMSRNSGKSGTLTTPVFSPPNDRGDKYPKKTIGDLKVGDFLYNEEGNLSEILHMNPIVFDEVYEVEFEDGEVIECNADHLWDVYDKYYNQRRETKITCTRNTDFIYTKFKAGIKKKENRFRVDLPKPLNYPNIQRLIIDPYILGYYLGDGTVNVGDITVGNQDIEDTMKNFSEHSTTTLKRRPNDRNDIWRVDIDREKELKEIGYDICNARENSFKTKLKTLGILETKRIPERYLYGTVQQRWDLLAGLMDSDGSCNTDGSCEITQAEYHTELLEDIGKLLTSLGIKYSINDKEAKCNGKTFQAARIYFRADKTMPIFKLKRKFDRLPDERSFQERTKAIVDVRKTGVKKPMRCITVSNDSGLYLCGERGTITHNSYLSAPYLMARSILIPNHHAYIMCPSGPQARQTFSKIEDLAKGQISSVESSTGVFLAELMKQNSADDGFVHDKLSYHCSLFNGSDISTLNSVAKNVVGFRSNLALINYFIFYFNTELVYVLILV